VRFGRVAQCYVLAAGLAGQINPTYLAHPFPSDQNVEIASHTVLRDRLA